uniref:S-layer homology domain-containing protein n=1 Tax=Paenibacillus luteus TaxID=2545753 RepID=UPI0011411E7E
TGFTVNSATQITATAPAGSGTVDVRVTTAGGTSATSAADQYTFIAAPTITSISPTAGPTTGGTTVILTGTNLSGATAVTFGATAATGFTVNSATQITATAPAGSGTVDVRVTTAGGTSATSAADQYTYVVLTYTISPLSNETPSALTAGYASGTQETKTVTVTRTGTGDLASLATALSGADASSFTVTQPATTTLDSGTTSTTFTVKANDGLAAGTYTATITVLATSMTPVTFTVTQVVNVPLTYTIDGLSNETPSALTAGYASGTQETKTVTVTRTGTGDLASLATALSGADASSFTVTQPATTTLDSGTTSTTFTVKANDGLAAGTYTATVTVSATSMAPVTFTVTQVVNVPLTYTIDGLSNETPSALTAGYASGTQETKTVTVTRTGTGDLASLATALSGADASSFTVTQPATTTLDSGTTSTTFTVKANDGLAAGTYTATITVLATSMTPVTFTVTQVVNVPLTYTIDGLSNETPSALTAGYASGTQETKTVTVTRTGTGDLASLATALSGADASSFTVTQPATTTLDSGTASTTFTVKANDGLAAGTYTATVTVSAAGMTPVTFTVTQVVNSRNSGGTGGSPISLDVLTHLDIDQNGIMINSDTIDTRKPSVALEVAPKDGVAYVSLPASLLTEFEKKNATFITEIKATYGSYKIPVNLASLIPGLQDLLAKNGLKAEDISFKVTLTDKSGDKDIQAAVASGLPKGQVLGAIVDFNILIINTKSGQVIGTADKFSSALTRIIPMSKNMTDIPEQWGVFRYNETTKKFEFVSAKKVLIDGAWYVTINSYSNSVYVVAQNPVSFTDTLKHWSKAFVELAAAKGLVEGVGDGKYDPDKAVTRAEFTAMIVRTLGRSGSVGNAAPYVDVKQGAWYFDEVAKAKELGLLGFTTGTSFKPDQPLSREEMASMLAAVINLEKLSIAKDSVNLNGYKDIGSVDAAYLEDVRTMVTLQIMNGTSANTLDPKGETTRAQAAVVFIRMLQTLGSIDR